MTAVRSIPDDELATELASSWDPEDGPPPALTALAPAEPAGPWRPSGPQDLPQAAARVRPVSLAGDQVLPVLGALEGVFPTGLPRGAIVRVDGGPGGGALSLALALGAAPSAAGSWMAVVGLPGLGLVAAAEVGVSLERVVVVEPPPPDQWATVVGALVGACDLVLVAPPPVVRLGEARRLAARARERGSVLVQVGAPIERARDAGDEATAHRGPGRTSRAGGSPALDATLRLRVVDQRWLGLGDGHGHLRSRWVRVELDGRRHASRPRRADLWLPDDEGRLRAATADERRPPRPTAATGPVDQGPDDVRQHRLRRVLQPPLPPTTEAPTMWSDAG